MKENNKTRFEYDVNSENSLIRIRAIQGHTEGNTIPLELLDHSEKIEKLKIGSFTKFIREDLKKEHTEMTKSQSA